MIPVSVQAHTEPLKFRQLKSTTHYNSYDYSFVAKNNLDVRMPATKEREL